jgi:hypothetical protein
MMLVTLKTMDPLCPLGALSADDGRGTYVSCGKQSQ